MGEMSPFGKFILVFVVGGAIIGVITLIFSFWSEAIRDFISHFHTGKTYTNTQIVDEEDFHI